MATNDELTKLIDSIRKIDSIHVAEIFCAVCERVYDEDLEADAANSVVEINVDAAEEIRHALARRIPD